jgi:hypothetical protein
MAFVSITRLRLRSFLYLLSFIVHASRSSNQIIKAKGFLKGKTLLDKNLTFWTMSLWASDAEMRAYRNTDAHKKAMPKLQQWCDEASIVHWLQDDAEFPSWDQSHKRMLAEGRSSKVKRPSDDHVNFRIPSPRYPSKTERILLPKK